MTHRRALLIASAVVLALVLSACGTRSRHAVQRSADARGFVDLAGHALAAGDAAAAAVHVSSARIALDAALAAQGHRYDPAAAPVVPLPAPQESLP